MNGHASSGLLMDSPRQWSFLFAKDMEEDLDFDEGLEDNDLGQPKPPRRRAFLWIFILLLAVGVVYWGLESDFSLFSSPDSSSDSVSPPGIALPDAGQMEVKPFRATSVPTPQFSEGQEVVLLQEPGKNTPSVTLMGNASGTKLGPSVKLGEVLTILDGEMVGDGWVYNVRTQSGVTGWVLEKALTQRIS